MTRKPSYPTSMSIGLLKNRRQIVSPFQETDSTRQRSELPGCMMCHQRMPPTCTYREQKSSTNAHSKAAVTSHFFMLPGVCTKHPGVVLYCDYLTERLIPRIRYNLSAKLKGMEHMPRLHFRSISAEQIIPTLRRAAARV